MTKILELLLLFLGIPTFFLLDIHPVFKVIVGFSGFIYVLWVSFKIEKISLRKEFSLAKFRNVKRLILVRFLGIAILTTLFIYLFQREDLFNVVIPKPRLWISFVLVYSFISVIPQEFIYRSFFFKRYRSLFKSEFTFLLINSMLFSFAHIWFRSWVVLGFTFVGSVLFNSTYKRTNSLLILCIEHAIYGSWLYTVGYGELFMFPT